MLFRTNLDEKRDFARMGVKCPATLQVLGEEEEHPVMATNLSASGMHLTTSIPFKEGMVVTVRMTPEKTIVPPLQAKAEVVRCSEDDNGDFLVGLKILEMLPGL